MGRKTLTEIADFSSEPYSIEELIAEMGAAYLYSYTEILDKEIKSSAAYIQGWLDKFKNDKRFIISASGQAQKAVDFILGKKGDEEKEEVDEPVVG